MGALTRRVVALVCALAGFYGAIAGVVYALYIGSGRPPTAVGVELEAIAAVALGGSPLAGGVGFIAGRSFGA